MTTAPTAPWARPATAAYAATPRPGTAGIALAGAAFFRRGRGDAESGYRQGQEGEDRAAVFCRSASLFFSVFFTMNEGTHISCRHPAVCLANTILNEITALQRGGPCELRTMEKEVRLVGSHDEAVSLKIGKVLTGGDISGKQKVSEQYLLDLEREAFLQLCGMRKTQERIKHMLEKGKALRN